MSSVAVLTPESFAEHRSGLKDQEIAGNILHYLLPVSTQSLQAKTFCILKFSSFHEFTSRYVFPSLLHLSLDASCCFLPSVFMSVSGGGAGCVPEDEAYIPTYLEAFPPLPEKGAPGEKAVEPAAAWGSKIRPIKASVITQVSHKHSPDDST